MIADKILVTNVIEKDNENKIMKSFFYAALQNFLPVAMWRKPNEDPKTIIADLSGKTEESYGKIENLDKGFILSPFINNDKCHFLKADILFKSGYEEIKTSYNAPFNNLSKQNKEVFFNTLNSFLQKNTSSYFSQLPDKKINLSAKKNYLRLVEKGIENIHEGIFNKVVVSRAKEIDLPQNFNYVESFNFLCEAYPSAFISLIYTPEFGVWMGATPEILIRVNENNSFQTIALAGTQSKDKYKILSEVAWTQKEIEEQALVCRYIINCFKKIRLREFEEFGPRTIAAGNLLHLCTDFIVNMGEVNFNNLGSVMLSLLHPTSAVCGMPKPQAMDFIAENEGYNRELYSGFLGLVNFETKTDIFVNLRCMQVLNNKAILYAGGGITRDSVPEKEWKETEMKMGVMGKLFE